VTINQIRTFLIEQSIAVRVGASALPKSLFAILENRKDEISPRMAKLICGLYEDWPCLDERIETVTAEIEELSRIEPKCQRLMSVPGSEWQAETASRAVRECLAVTRGRNLDRGASAIRFAASSRAP
jgi:hypothetical protein